MRTFAQTTSAKFEASRRSRVEQTRAASPIQKLQSRMGNQALQRMLRAHAEKAKEDASERARSSGGLSPTRGSAPAGIQAKLTVNTPGDAYEQEADRAADQVMRMPEPEHSSADAKRPGGHSGHAQVPKKTVEATEAFVQAPVVSSTPPTIVHETIFPAPDGAPNTRTEVGVGEEVLFTGSTAGTWKTNAGISVAEANGTQLRWTAPSRAASAMIELTVGQMKAKTTLKVIEPATITGVKVAEISYPPGIQGAGMELIVYHPRNVSFGRVWAKEISGAASNVKGLFKKMPDQLGPGGILYHHTGPPTRIELSNTIPGDKAFISGLVSWPIGGSFDWIIPNAFMVGSPTASSKIFTYVTQHMHVEGDDNPQYAGTTTVAKLGQEVVRKP